MAASNHNLGDKNRGNLDGDDTENLSGDRVRDEDRKGVLDQEREEEDEEEIIDEDYEAPLEVDDFISDDDDSEEQVLADEALSPKEQDAGSLAIRRAIERRQEQKKLDEDLNYLDLDLDT
ncbi:MAG: hypothetical protein E2O59_10755 [Gammaproteobacteria bacterium]|nr:MAG: hypothetical protein E2O59_10755 [Gammaproteobacteria bacterium]